MHGHANHISDIYSIYVTDYTSKSGTFVEHSSEWCPVSLADHVLRIEMWRGDAVALAQQMKPGEYWSLDNVRMKHSNGGYIEGSFSEAAKARKLSVTDIDINHHLLALLQCVPFQLGLKELFLSHHLQAEESVGRERRESTRFSAQVVQRS